MGDVERLARAIRDSVLVGPMGPNARTVHDEGGSVSLTGTEAAHAADRFLASDWLAAHDAEVAADARREALREAAELVHDTEIQGLGLSSAYRTIVREAASHTPEGGR